MAQHKSAKKRIKTSRRAAIRNRRTISVARKAVKEFKSSKDKPAALLSAVYKVVDKTAAKGVYHKNKAARVKSRMAKLAAKSGK